MNCAIPVLRVENLTKSYIIGHKKRVLFRDFSVTVNEGEFLALVGRSGTGKTTLMNMLAGIDKPDSGMVTVLGNVLSSCNEDQLSIFRLKHIGLVFQDFNLLPTLTLFQNIVLPMRLAKQGYAHAKERVSQLVEDVGIASVSQQLPHAVSGGEAQRAAIARALVNNPRLILADEPTGNLDITTARQILELLEKVRAHHGVTVVMVTHDRDVMRSADRVVELA